MSAASAMSLPVLSAVSPPISAVASGVQLGVPRPKSAGTHQGPPSARPDRAPGLIRGHCPAPSTPSWRSQPVTAPAFGTNPSSAYAVVSAARQAQVDTTPRGTPVGGALPALHHKNAPVPSVSFAMPSRQQRWPNSAACWSPTTAPIVALPPQTAGSVTASGPAVGATVGSIRAGMPNKSSIASSQALSARLNSIVRDAIDGSVTCAAPALSNQVSQQPTSPKSRSPRAAARLTSASSSSSQRSLVALNAGSSGSPVRERTACSWPVSLSLSQASAALVS